MFICKIKIISNIGCAGILLSFFNGVHLRECLAVRPRIPLIWQALEKVLRPSLGPLLVGFYRVLLPINFNLHIKPNYLPFKFLLPEPEPDHLNSIMI